MPSPLQFPSPRRPEPIPAPFLTRKRILAITSLGVAGILVGLLSSCATATSTAASASPAVSYSGIAGNWQISSTSAAAAPLASLGGSLSVNGTAVTGILHPLATTGQCLSTSTPIPVSGSVDANGHLTLSSRLTDGALTISGTISEDRRSLSSVTYNVVGGACAFANARTGLSARDAVAVTAQQYQPLSGTYTGMLTGEGGEQFPLSTAISQTSQPDADGVYHLQGSAASPGNACVPSAVTATASTVDGSSVLTTFTDPSTGTSISATGNSSPDGTTLTITSWTLTSNCGSDSGTGTLTRQ